ncbi:MAG: dihydroorotase [Flavobacteriaceae bacterium]|nr:dihydroorotase [Flavobacteriaceae bacterium]
MKVLLKSATIVDPSSKHHLKKRDVLIEKGIIKKIAASISEPKAKVVDLPNLHISQGWFDSGVSLGEPGYEERENLDNGLQTAALSGFAEIAINPNSNPVPDTKSHVKYLKSKSEAHAVTAHVVGALTSKGKGIDLAEIYDMHSEGAISFYDYKKPIIHPNLLKIALQYAQNFGGLVQSFPMEPDVAHKGVANENVNSTKLGLNGIPSLSEELQMVRDLYILEYTGGKLHIPNISTAKSVELIKDAKKKGLQVSCSVSVNNLTLTDDVLESFDTNYKLMPPLRTSKDNAALLKGLKDGVIDGVTSDHDPMDVEHKRTEFDHASFGSIGLESCLGALLTVMDVELAVKSLIGLKKVFGLEEHLISEGTQANLSLFNPKLEKEFSDKDIHSTSKNSAQLGRKLKGVPYGIYNNGQLVING